VGRFPADVEAHQQDRLTALRLVLPTPGEAERSRTAADPAYALERSGANQQKGPTMDSTTATTPTRLIPVRFANYPGDCTHMIGEVKGPNLLGEMLTAVTAEHDTGTDTTRVGFVYGVREVAR
jgi:hypothetical protein